MNSSVGVSKCLYRSIGHRLRRLPLFDRSIFADLFVLNHGRNRASMQHLCQQHPLHFRNKNKRISTPKIPIVGEDFIGEEHGEFNLQPSINQFQLLSGNIKQLKMTYLNPFYH